MPQRNADMIWSGLFRLTQDGSQTLQSQIRQAVVSAVLDRLIPLDMPLPSCRKLAESLGVARGTVALAFQELVDQGFLIARERRGHFINPDALTEPPRQAPAKPHPVATLNWQARLAVNPSGLANIAKPADWQAYPYPFVYGQFDPSLFPTNAWRECARMALGVREIKSWAVDMVDQDDPLLIEQILARLLPRRGIFCHPDEIMITLGAQNALFMLSVLLIGRQTKVAMEDPGYPDARNIFALATDRLAAVPVDEAGLDPARIPDGTDIVFTTPGHQCPTTANLDLARREALLRRAQADDFIILEDDYDSQFLSPEKPLAALKSMDRAGRVIHIGSLSKTLAPGLRIGFVVAAPELIRQLRDLRRMMLRHPPANNQRAVALFLSLGHYDALVRRWTGAAAARRAALTEAMAAHMPRFAETMATGGTAAWISGPDGFNADRLAAAARDQGVLIEPGGIFFSSGAGRAAFRLGVSSIASDRIDAGIRHLAMAARTLAINVA